MENSCCLNLIMLQQPQEKRYPFLPVSAVFSCLQTMVYIYIYIWLPVFGNLSMHTYVDACDCILGLYENYETVCTESLLWEKKPLPISGNWNPHQYCTWLFGSNALPSELSCPCYVRHQILHPNTQKVKNNTHLIWHDTTSEFWGVCPFVK